MRRGVVWLELGAPKARLGGFCYETTAEHCRQRRIRLALRQPWAASALAPLIEAMHFERCLPGGLLARGYVAAVGSLTYESSRMLPVAFASVICKQPAWRAHTTTTIYFGERGALVRCRLFPLLVVASVWCALGFGFVRISVGRVSSGEPEKAAMHSPLD